MDVAGSSGGRQATPRAAPRQISERRLVVDIDERAQMHVRGPTRPAPAPIIIDLDAAIVIRRQLAHRGRFALVPDQRQARQTTRLPPRSQPVDDRVHVRRRKSGDRFEQTTSPT